MTNNKGPRGSNCEAKIVRKQALLEWGPSLTLMNSILVGRFPEPVLACLPACLLGLPGLPGGTRTRNLALLLARAWLAPCLVHRRPWGWVASGSILVCSWLDLGLLLACAWFPWGWDAPTVAFSWHVPALLLDSSWPAPGC